jgi:predicted metal-dependent hydrolase
MLKATSIEVERDRRPGTLEQICTRVFHQLKPRSRPPQVAVEFCRFANPDSFVRIREGRLELRVTDLLEGAPGPVLEALAHILLGKLFRKPVAVIHEHRYRLYLGRREVQRSMHLLRQMRGRKYISGPRGQHYNLEEIFEELNQRYFNGLLARPLLGWSRRASRSTLGHYDPSHNALIINKRLDSASAPRLGVEYVLFHEMLHLRYPAQQRHGQRQVHTLEFREAEKLYPRLREAKALLKQL